MRQQRQSLPPDEAAGNAVTSIPTGNSNNNTQQLPTIGSHRRASDLCKLLAGLDVFQHGLLKPTQVLVALLQHGLQVGKEPIIVALPRREREAKQQ